MGLEGESLITRVIIHSLSVFGFSPSIWRKKMNSSRLELKMMMEMEEEIETGDRKWRANLYATDFFTLFLFNLYLHFLFLVTVNPKHSSNCSSYSRFQWVNEWERGSLELTFCSHLFKLTRWSSIWSSAISIKKEGE